MYGFVLWLVPTVEQFPRRQKFLLGDRLQATALDVLERLVEATYTRDRRRHLTAANLGIEKLRFLCRLAKDLGHLDARRYEHAARSLDETGWLVDGLGGQRSPTGLEETTAADSRAAARCSGVSRSTAPRRSISWARSPGGVPADATAAAGRLSVSSVFVFGMIGHAPRG